MIHTIGYEGAQLDAFLSTLKRANITLLIDVRDRAQSRRKGFSKTALSEALASSDIKYLHLKDLGDPKEGREAARSGDIAKFRDIYSRVLKTQKAALALEQVRQLLLEESICLLCYERDPLTCHRKMITDELKRTDKVNAQHIGVQPEYSKAA